MNPSSKLYASIQEKNLFELKQGDRLGSELLIEYEGSDKEFYYFHSVFENAWQDNSLLIYAKF